jgi:hypothetical protein
VRYYSVNGNPDGRRRTKTEEEMSEQISEQKKTLARRWFEDLFNRGDVDAADEILSADFVDHLTHEDEHGLEEIKHHVTMYHLTRHPRYCGGYSGQSGGDTAIS